MEPKDENIELKMSKEDKELLSEAASMIKMDLASFILEAAQRRASDLKRDRIYLLLSKKKAKIF